MSPQAKRAIWYKGAPTRLVDQPLEDTVRAAPRVLDDEMMLPVALLRASALDANARWMSAFLAHTGVEIAPHGKTTMSPELIARQLQAGAWAITAATAHHVRLYAEWGVPRILLANQLIGRANIEAVVRILAGRPELDFYCLVDSVEGAVMLADAARRLHLGHPIQVLLELGGAGERAGVRELPEAVAIARAIAAQGPYLALRGIECFEGVYSDVIKARSLLLKMAEAARALAASDVFKSDEVIVTAGGTALLDEAARVLLSTALGRPVRRVLRSGCYLTHDSRHYEHAFEAAVARSPELARIGRPRAAIEVWAHIQSRPEPRRAIASLGKRDVGYDIDLPVPLWIHRPGRGGRPLPANPDIAVAKLYDQHACLEVTADVDLRVGDLIGFGISHPCTTFDKWRALFVVDDEYRVIDVVTTFF